ncbi:MAG: hypothetical protein F4187_00650 [Gemmatimonadetes bacterium]|nr:hypothetical protein [Gemmatimonadota bacterium]
MDCYDCKTGARGLIGQEHGLFEVEDLYTTFCRDCTITHADLLGLPTEIIGEAFDRAVKREADRRQALRDAGLDPAEVFIRRGLAWPPSHQGE